MTVFEPIIKEEEQEPVKQVEMPQAEKTKLEQVVEIVENIVGKTFFKKLFKSVTSIQDMQTELLFVQKKFQVYDEAVVLKCAEAFDQVAEFLEKSDTDV